MIRCDMEGASGIVSYNQAEPGMGEYEFGKRMFMSDLLAVVNGLNDGGADEIHIYDEHFFGRNIDIDLLPDNVVTYCGKPPYQKDWAGGIDATFAGMILLGLHSMQGTGELLHHTYEPDIERIYINNILVGEIGVETAIAGDYGVPLLLITGDSAGVEEAKGLVPNVRSVVVKESKAVTGALCYPISVTKRNIYNSAKKIALDIPVIEAFTIGKSVVLKVQLFSGNFKDKFVEQFPWYIKNDIVTITAKTMTIAWAEYWKMKLKCL